jgi:hypothetical protein
MSKKVTRSTLRAMRRHAKDCYTAQRYGWASNSKDALLRQAAKDITRLADEVERLKYKSISTHHTK